MTDQVPTQEVSAHFDVVHKHQCGICNRRFKKSEHLSRHERSRKVSLYPTSQITWT
ncbi:hypothetical protein BGZ60DRAFT_508100 [Tricladium varicosporioides]|nr:hypothetical protein BGZ60DRAFT_508100 [Hymenoscyphus varicosporioides]